MQTWMIYAVLSMMFAGVTAVLAKYGLQNISADLGLGIRTTIIFVIIAVINLVGAKYKEFSNLTNFAIASSSGIWNHNHSQLAFLLPGN